MDWIQIYAIVIATLLSVSILINLSKAKDRMDITAAFLLPFVYAPIFLRVWGVL